MADRDGRDQGRLAFADQSTAAGPEVGVQAHATSDVEDRLAELDRAFPADVGASPGFSGGFVGDRHQPGSSVGADRVAESVRSPRASQLGCQGEVGSRSQMVMWWQIAAAVTAVWKTSW